MLQKKILSTSTTRFASIVEIFDFSPIKIKQKKKKVITNKKKKIFYKYKQVSLSSLKNLSNLGVVQYQLYNKKPYQLFLYIQSIFGNSLIIPGTEYILPGHQYFNLTQNLIIKNVTYRGSQISLESAPFGLFLNTIGNNFNNKWTFAKSSGCFITKLKAKKTVKLILTELPSSKKYLFLRNTRGFIGKCANFFNNKFIEGKWGFSLHMRKHINVRGVAMNPVDHPNGGRTKAKQPEKSPWGWIAKSKK